MIQVPTVFIIGAGASKESGFPLGGELLHEARNMDDLARKLLGQSWEGPRDALYEFKNSVTEYTGPSIDIFLENQPSLTELGRLVIATLLAPYAKQREEAQTKPVADWLKLIVDGMVRGTTSADQFVDRNKKIAFVTFNFDNLIEEGLRSYSRHFFSPDSQRRRQEGEIEVLHLHGRLPAPAALSSEWVREAAKNIRVIHDDLDQKVVARAQQLISEATVVCLLGLNYGEENLRTLGIDKVLKRGQQEVFGSSYMMRAGKREAVTRLFARQIRLAEGHKEGNDCKCEGTLEQFDVLRV